jgi:hypothetical protein
MARIHSLCVALALLTACSSSSNAPNGTVTDEDAALQDDAAVEDTAPAALVYPAGPYGLAKGMVFPNFTFKGYKKGTGEWTDLSMLDYYDPDGTHGVYGIYYVVGAQWCGPCNQEADMLSKFYPEQYRDRGGVILSRIIQDTAGNPATQKTVDQWVKTHHVNFDIGLDSASESLPKSGSVGLPYNYLIDPRTMKVYTIIQGVSPSATTILPLNVMLTRNGAPPADGG